MIRFKTTEPYVDIYYVANLNEGNTPPPTFCWFHDNSCSRLKIPNRRNPQCQSVCPSVSQHSSLSRDRLSCMLLPMSNYRMAVGASVFLRGFGNARSSYALEGHVLHLRLRCRASTISRTGHCSRRTTCAASPSRWPTRRSASTLRKGR